MDNERRLQALREYVENTKRILALSSPGLQEIDSAEDYRLHLQHAFMEVGELGRKNTVILNENLLPILEEDYELTDNDVAFLYSLSDLFADTTRMENLDLPLIYKQAEKLCKSAEQRGDIRSIILAEDSMVIASYMMLNMSVRLYPEIDVCLKYRERGIESAKNLLEYLPHEKFAALPDDQCRELILINSRYIRCLFEWIDKEDPSFHNEEDLRLMRQALDVAEDPFYREMMPDYMWDIHVLRTLQYIADFTEGNNSHRFNAEQLQQIYEYTLKLKEFMAAHPELEDRCPDLESDFYVSRNAFLAGHKTLEEYRNDLLSVMAKKDTSDFSARSMFVIFTAPLEYILTLDKENLTETHAVILRSIYLDLASYAFHMPKTGGLSFMLTFLSDFLKNYIEVPGGTTFRDMCLQLMAAMHTPTYVHTLNVASISRYLAEKLIDEDPEEFLGIEDAATVKEVKRKKSQILDYVYESAMLHDTGKLFVTETIMTYGRSLIDIEWDLIKAHAKVGADLLASYESTKKYADVAHGHHKWYDESVGYPDDFHISDSKYKTIIAIVEAADSLDAATDSIGRSYNKGKTLEECILEITSSSDKRYCGSVAKLLDKPDVRNHLQYLISEGRDDNYRKAYYLLKNLNESTGNIRIASEKDPEILQSIIAQLQDRYDFLLAAVDNLPNPVFIKDENARFFYFNKAYADFFGMRRRDYIGTTVLDLDYIPEEDRIRFQSEDLSLIKNADILSYSTTFKTGDEKGHPSFYWSRGFYDKTSSKKGLVGEIVDITKERELQKSLDESLENLKDANEKLSVMAKTDPASGLYNRTVLREASLDFASSKGNYPRTCMIMVDFDNFKEINDEFGHLKGDESLSQFADILRSECRPTDLPIRYGGDEFLVILSNIDLEDGLKVAERIRSRCEKEMALPNGKTITISAGVIEVDNSETFERNLSRLDDLLYHAKDAGRNRVVY